MAASCLFITVVLVWLSAVKMAAFCAFVGPCSHLQCTAASVLTPFARQHCLGNVHHASLPCLCLRPGNCSANCAVGATRPSPEHLSREQQSYWEGFRRTHCMTWHWMSSTSPFSGCDHDGMTLFHMVGVCVRPHVVAMPGAGGCRATPLRGFALT